MTAMMLAGCLLIAYGPPALLLLGYASRRAALLILTIASAFFWLLSIFLTSVIWIIIPPLKETHPFIQVIGILIQEAVRFFFVWVYAKSEKAADSMMRRGGPKLFNDFSAGISAGLGFGAMHTVMMYGAVIATSRGEAAFYLDTCPGINMYIWTAVAALMYNVLHIVLMIIAIEAYRRWNYTLAALPFLMHLAFGLVTIANTTQNGCEISLPIMIAIAIIGCLITWWIERSPDYAAKRQQRAWEVLVNERGFRSDSSPGLTNSISSAPSGLRQR